MAKFDFNPKKHQSKILALIQALAQEKNLDQKHYHRLLRRYPKASGVFFTKAEVIKALRYFQLYPGLIRFLRMKPIRTSSGVVPLTLLTKPYPCPGQCLYCPNEANMPKSYLANEPGGQRAVKNQFDPYRQVLSRLQSYQAIGHPTDKIELIILGGTWSAYPLGYRIWFVKRCFEALNQFVPGKKLSSRPERSTEASWSELSRAQKINETAKTRAVGLSLETRPDSITPREVVRLRRLGCTKVQLGLQSLDDRVLKLNQRGHQVKASRQAIKLLRLAGFKIQAHWMANLYGSSPGKDRLDFKKLFSDPDFRPDELKIYPTSLLRSAPLYQLYQKGLWQPYSNDQLLSLLKAILPEVPAYCRVTRIMRDFSAQDIVSGSRLSNLRQLVEAQLQKQGKTINEIRFREIRQEPLKTKNLKLKTLSYRTSIGQEKFLQLVTPENRLVGFLRLSLPELKPFIKELQGSALIREIHVYGQSLALGEKSAGQAQHLGFGQRLIDQARGISRSAGYRQLSVISAVGTREYYRQRQFLDGRLYQHLNLLK